MKLFYMCFKSDKAMKGVEKKRKYEIKAFKLNGIDTEEVIIEKESPFIRIIPFQGKFNWCAHANLKGVSALYIRYGFASFPFIFMLRSIRKNNPKIKIIIEIGSFPYDKEFIGYKKILWVRDVIYRRFLRKYVDRIAINRPFEEIYGVKVLQFVNPIDVDSINVSNRVNRNDGNVINLVAVASLAHYHGYDRLISGIANYYSGEGTKVDIVFHVVGAGSILPTLKKMVSDLKIEKYVKFYGFLSGEELEQMYDIADIGVDELGGHRQDDLHNETIKSKEYISRGIPYITEYSVPEKLSPIKKYIFSVSPDETAIDIASIVNFYRTIRKEEQRETTVAKMRSFAYSYCDVSVAMNSVIDYILGDE
ncbi:glycosyltransferase [uncultured Anaerovibrio sp.]|uniref:glycosyltransferase n=1 Tax=uncultured Anaerovibrio sp. TaxID=361586 RepID=UPI0026026C2A|nr:glycosyltransferase [uncultured Anaerovibrio sp.]